MAQYDQETTASLAESFAVKRDGTAGEINLAACFGFAHRIRYLLVAGVVGGFLVGFLLSTYRNPPIYESKYRLGLSAGVPVMIPAEKAAMLSAFNNAFLSVEPYVAAFKELAAQQPQFVRRLEEAGYDTARLLALQADSGRRAPLLLEQVESGNTFVATLRLPISGFDVSAPNILAQMLNAVARVENERTLNSMRVAGSQLGAHAEQVKSTTQENETMATQKAAADLELVKLRTEMSSIVFSLWSRLKKSGVAMGDYWPVIVNSISQYNASEQTSAIANELCGMLHVAKIMSDAELLTVQTELAKLQNEIHTTKNLRAVRQAVADSSQNSLMLESMIRSADKRPLLLPNLEADGGPLAVIQSELKVSPSPIPGAAAGSIFGVVLMALLAAMYFMIKGQSIEFRR